VRASELEVAHGTPLVVLCEETIQARARALRQAVGDGRVFFGTKALPNVAVLRLLLSEGIGADVASSGELAFARNAGLGGGDLVVHGNNKARCCSPRPPRSEPRSSSTLRTSRRLLPPRASGRRSCG